MVKDDLGGLVICAIEICEEIYAQSLLSQQYPLEAAFERLSSVAF